jgi:hypothetical protein
MKVKAVEDDQTVIIVSFYAILAAATTTWLNESLIYPKGDSL